MSVLIAKMLVLETKRHTWGTDIPQVVREQNFGKPLSVDLVQRLANSMLNPETVKVVGLDAEGKQVGAWLYAYSDVSLEAPAKAKGQSAPAVKKAKTTEEKQTKAQEVKLSKAAQERAEMAKASNARLPIQLMKLVKSEGSLPCVDRFMTSIPFTADDSKVTIRLFRADGTFADVPVFKGLYTSAVSRGKALLKKDPSADSLVCLKRLMSELLLGQDEIAIVSSEDSEDTVTHYTRGRTQGTVKTNRDRVITKWVKAVLTSSNLVLELSRDQAYECQPALKGETPRKKDTTQYHKRVIPFGSNAISFMGRAKDTHVSFSRG